MPRMPWPAARIVIEEPGPHLAHDARDRGLDRVDDVAGRDAPAALPLEQVLAADRGVPEPGRHRLAGPRGRLPALARDRDDVAPGRSGPRAGRRGAARRSARRPRPTRRTRRARDRPARDGTRRRPGPRSAAAPGPGRASRRSSRHRSARPRPASRRAARAGGRCDRAAGAARRAGRPSARPARRRPRPRSAGRGRRAGRRRGSGTRRRPCSRPAGRRPGGRRGAGRPRRPADAAWSDERSPRCGPVRRPAGVTTVPIGASRSSTMSARTARRSSGSGIEPSAPSSRAWSSAKAVAPGPADDVVDGQGDRGGRHRRPGAAGDDHEVGRRPGGELGRRLGQAAQGRAQRRPGGTPSRRRSRRTTARCAARASGRAAGAGRWSSSPSRGRGRPPRRRGPPARAAPRGPSRHPSMGGSPGPPGADRARRPPSKPISMTSIRRSSSSARLAVAAPIARRASSAGAASSVRRSRSGAPAAPSRAAGARSVSPSRAVASPNAATPSAMRPGQDHEAVRLPRGDRGDQRRQLGDGAALVGAGRVAGPGQHAVDRGVEEERGHRQRVGRRGARGDDPPAAPGGGGRQRRQGALRRGDDRRGVRGTADRTRTTGIASTCGRIDAEPGRERRGRGREPLDDQRRWPRRRRRRPGGRPSRAGARRARPDR